MVFRFVRHAEDIGWIIEDRPVFSESGVRHALDHWRQQSGTRHVREKVVVIGDHGTVICHEEEPRAIIGKYDDWSN